jgi:nicotinamidase/pyrazinamidase
MIFFDVDTQVDFLDPGGRLYVPGSENLRPSLQRLTAWAGDHGLHIISTACAHQPDDPELKVFGQHCIAGTPGQKKVPETLLSNQFVVPNRPVELGDLRAYPQIIIEKQDFDFGTNPNSRKVLMQFGPGLDIVLYGVVTEICVAAAARSLFAWGHKVSLVRDVIAGLDSAKSDAFVSEFTGRGGKLVKEVEITSLTCFE